MFGSFMNPGDAPGLEDIVPRAAMEIVQGIGMKQAVGVRTRLLASYVEIYGEQVFALNLMQHSILLN